MELKQFGPLKIFFVREYRDHKPLKKTGNINFCKQNWNALVLIFARFSMFHKMDWKILLSGEIQSDWREALIPVIFPSHLLHRLSTRISATTWKLLNM